MSNGKSIADSRNRRSQYVFFSLTGKVDDGSVGDNLLFDVRNWHEHYRIIAALWLRSTTNIISRICRAYPAGADEVAKA
ncbi:MAG: hypothetical protein ACLQVD_22065 [Capsulimonadaceae bacterium]